MDRLTLLDIAKQTDPDGTSADIVDVLQQTLPLLADAPAFASNQDMGERITRRLARPTVAWGQINQGVTRSKGANTQLTETIGMLNARAEVDARIPFIVGTERFNAARWNENKGFLEAMAIGMAATLMYGNNASEFTGLQPRLQTASTLSTGSQVRRHHAAPGADITSIYVCDWGERGVHLLYPKHHKAGIISEDLGKIQVNDAAGNPFSAYVTEYLWMVGLAVKDPRRIARLANIDISQALADVNVRLKDSMVQLLNGMPPKNGFNRVMYTHKDIITAFELQIDQKSNVMFSWQEYLGEKVLHFRGIPMRACDSISAAETAV